MSRLEPVVQPPDPPADRIWFTERSTGGLEFTERMSGFIGLPVEEGDQRSSCQRAIGPRVHGTERMECTLTVVIADLEAMLRDRAHSSRMVGTVAIGDGSPMAVRDGTFQLFVVRPDRVETRRMVYRMRVRPEGWKTEAHIEGYKEIRNSRPHHAWPDLTTLYVTISTGGYGREGRVFREGVLRLSFGDFLKQLTTLRVRNARRFVERLDGRLRFAGFFAQIVFGTYGRVLAPSKVAVADAPPPLAPRREWTPDSPQPIITSDGVKIQLTRYPGGTMGPVLLVPGFTTVASSFDTPTVKKNLVQFLCDKGFDVWLLDYRASPAFEPAWSAFSIDDIARRDYPAAVRAVCQATGAPKVQIVAHCVGSISLFMSLLDGQLRGLVRSVIASQVAAHVVVVPFTEAKSGLYLGSLLRLLGVKHISASFDSRKWSDWIIDQALKLYPSKERCSNPVCRRLLFIFQEIYRHKNLNSETHDAIYQWFGVSSMSALKHLSLMVRTGHVVDSEGQDVYLQCDDAARHQANLAHLDLPISFMYGKHNRAFRRAATRTIYEELCRRHDEKLYKWQEFKDYGHFDCFIGRDADRDVFPWIHAELVRWGPQPLVI
jgi:choline dehydrogenase-like flavoprotein